MRLRAARVQPPDLSDPGTGDYMFLKLTIGAPFVALVLCCNSAQAAKVEYLERLDSQVYEASGTPAEIASRGKLCMSQVLSAGSVGGELIISEAPDTIVARNALEYSSGLGGLVKWQMRTRVVFEARDGRFRVSHTNIERYDDYGKRWTGLGLWKGSGHEDAESALQSQSAEIAKCAMTPTTKSDW